MLHNRTVIRIEGFFAFITLLVCISLSIPVYAWSVTDLPIYSQTIGGYTADGLMNTAQGVATDSSGNIYVADTYNFRIQKFDSSGNFLMKFGSHGSGDGQFESPRGITVDTLGNIYVVDGSLDRGQKFDASGNFLMKFGGPGTGDGQFNGISAVSVDAALNIYVADVFNNRIQKFDSSGNFLLKFGSAGSGNGQFNTPYAIKVDSSGNIYVGDSYNYRVQKFDSSGNFLMKFGSQGTGDGQFRGIYGITLDADGNIYTTDGGNARVQKFSPTGTFLMKFGSGGTGNGQFKTPFGVSVATNGNIIIADSGNSRIEVFNSSGSFLFKFGSNMLASGNFYRPQGVGVDGTGNIYVADTFNNRVQKFSATGQFIRSFGSQGSADGQFSSPYGLAVTPAGRVYVCDMGNQRIQVFDTDGNFLFKFGSAGTGNGQFTYPEGLTLDTSGNVYVFDTRGYRIEKFDANGNFLMKFGSQGSGDGQFDRGSGIAVDTTGNIYTIEYYSGHERVQKFDTNGNFLMKFGSEGSGDGQFNGPNGIFVDAFGYIYVVDSGNYRIQVFDALGNFVSKVGSFGNGNFQYNYPYSGTIIANKIYIADSLNHRILHYNLDRTAPTVNITHLTNDLSTSSSFSFVGSVTDDLSAITSLQYQLDSSSGTWSNITPSDGTLDELSEDFSIPLSNIAEGAHTIYVRSTDSYTNTTTTSYSFTVDSLPPTGSISINSGAIGTTSQSVTLSLTASDPGTAVTGMKLSEDPSFAGVSWTTFSSSTSFTLSSGEGLKTVYLKLKDTTGNESTYSDTIYYDVTPPSNASNIHMTHPPGTVSIPELGWNNNQTTLSWTAGSDSGSGIKGYCLSVGTTAQDPASTKGLLGTSPIDTTGTPCHFIIATSSINLSNASVHGSTWLTSSSSPYYLSIKALDNADNVYQGTAVSFGFTYDGTLPKNVNYITTPGSIFGNVSDMFFSWPTTGAEASDDSGSSNSGLLGWQYQLNGTSGSWMGTTHSDSLGLNYIPTTDSTYHLTDSQDGSSITLGDNTVYFRTIDIAGNPSSDATIRTGLLKFGGTAPYFGGGDSVTVTPGSSTANSYALSWPTASAEAGQTVTHYYYMVNTPPPSNLSTLQGNGAMYFDTGTSVSVAARSLPNVNQGVNHVYVVAIDSADPANYSPSNVISGSFTLNSTDPDNVGNLVATDSSIKSQSDWAVTLTWSTPSYQGAGNLSYLIFRSEDGLTFTQVGTSQGLSYVDSPSSSRLYYYKVVTKDGANAQSSGTNAVNIVPTGKWTSAPVLGLGPTVSGITASKATISWTTSRSADSKIQFGTKSGIYNAIEPSNSTQTSAHSIQLTGLIPNTLYYYKVKWTDEDGNTGISDEHTFVTASAPVVKNLGTTSINISSATVRFTETGATSVKIYYGPTTSFGNVVTQAVSSTASSYSVPLVKLSGSTKYYYKLNPIDADGFEYQGTIYDFTTLPQPTISQVKIQQVADAAQETVKILFSTNTKVTSIVTVYPESDSSRSQSIADSSFKEGSHSMQLVGLKPQTKYIVTITITDTMGNQTTSAEESFTTASDTRPPVIENLKVETVITPKSGGATQNPTAQIIVSWDTDELSSSQVQFGQGTGSSYEQTSPIDANYTYNHVVVISNVEVSKVYHLKALSADAAGNQGISVDTLAITPKATTDALDLVIQNLSESFKFLQK